MHPRWESTWHHTGHISKSSGLWTEVQERSKASIWSTKESSRINSTPRGYSSLGLHTRAACPRNSQTCYQYSQNYVVDTLSGQLRNCSDLRVRPENIDILKAGDSSECTLDTTITYSHSGTIIQPPDQLAYYQSWEREM